MSMNNKMIALLSIFLCTMLLLSACVLPLRYTEVRGSGNLKTISRPLSGIDAVELSGIGTLIIHQGDVESLEITAEESLLDYIKSDIKGSNLIIGIEEYINMRPTKDITYKLTVKELQRLSTSGMGQVEVYKLNSDRLYVTISGSGGILIEDLEVEKLLLETSGLGDIKISGFAKEQEVNISGMATYNAEELMNQTALINISGAGNAVVWVTEKLDASISGAGKIQYYGEPVVNTDISGAGSIDSLGEK